MKVAWNGGKEPERGGVRDAPVSRSSHRMYRTVRHTIVTSERAVQGPSGKSEEEKKKCFPKKRENLRDG